MKDSISVLTNITLTSGAQTGINATRVDLSTKNWSQLTLQAVLTNGGTGPTNNQAIIIYYAFFDTSFSAASAVANLSNQKRPFVLTTTSTANAVQDLSTSPIDVTGDFLYLWINKPTTGQSVTLTLNAVETGISSAPAIITAATATLSQATTALTVFTILAANLSRKGANFYNGSNQNVKVKFGTGATTSVYSLIVNPGGFYEMAQPVYTGDITGICDASPTGNVFVTELT